MRSALALWALSLCCCQEVAEVLTARAPEAAGAAAASAGHAGATIAGAAADGGQSSAGGSSGASAGESGLPDPALPPSLSAGAHHTCFAREGLVYCWGDNRDGQLGSGDTAPHVGPVRVVGASGVTRVSVGDFHTCWLDRAGVVWCVGDNSYGQLGRPDADGLTAMPVVLPAPAHAIDVNFLHSCAVLETYELYCWGENVETQLGQGDAPDENQFEPVRVPVPGEVEAAACGQGHTLALLRSGDVAAWGRNTAGEAGLGPGLPVRIREPTLITTETGFATLDAGQDSACAVKGGGELYCWGAGSDQHLATQSEDTVWAPLQVGTGSDWTAVSLDTFHTCAIDAESRMYCWGRAIEGQLGLGNNDRLRPMPTQVGEAEWRQVAVGRFHTCALTLDGRCLCAGANDTGQLGTADLEGRNVFTEVLLPEP